MNGALTDEALLEETEGNTACGAALTGNKAGLDENHVRLSHGPMPFRAVAPRSEVEALFRQFQEIWSVHPAAHQIQMEGERQVENRENEFKQSETKQSETKQSENEKNTARKDPLLNAVRRDRRSNAVRKDQPLTEKRKQALLRTLRASIVVRVFPLSDTVDFLPPAPVPGVLSPGRPTRTRSLQTGEPYSVGGRVTVALELPTLGMIGVQAVQIAETNDDMADYWQWRKAKPAPTPSSAIPEAE